MMCWTAGWAAAAFGNWEAGLSTVVTLELDITAAAAAPGEETKCVKILCTQQLHHNHRQTLTSAGISVLMHFICDVGVKIRLPTNMYKVYKNMCGGVGIILN